jgi:hypothetical protein
MVAQFLLPSQILFHLTEERGLAGPELSFLEVDASLIEIHLVPGESK